MKSRDLNRIKIDLEPFKGKFDCVLFGSIVEGSTRPSSDIDVALLSYGKEKKKNQKLQMEILGIVPLKYDVRVFELFPITIKMSIIKNYEVIFGNPLEISEYFYKYRKEWDDIKHRIFSNQFSDYLERLKLMKNLDKIM
ncbi:MAG: hypothetical protein BAJALOKI2v1_300032 [Promethearchaeota archaeon]|nr:MAG: hypothetical protein BAJALOKI2v1_300032 [Candidatus Lokiarchaeota archaeon]